MITINLLIYYNNQDTRLLVIFHVILQTEDNRIFQVREGTYFYEKMMMSVYDKDAFFNVFSYFYDLDQVSQRADK